MPVSNGPLFAAFQGAMWGQTRIRNGCHATTQRCIWQNRTDSNSERICGNGPLTRHAIPPRH